MATVYDVIVVGSGTGSGTAGYVLTHAGLKVLMLEAGPFLDLVKDALQLKFSHESLRGGASTTRAIGEFDAAYGGWELDGEPCTIKDKTELTGSASTCWAAAPTTGGHFPAHGPRDFKCHQIDGLTDDWPITDDEVKPFHDKVDRLIRVYVTVESLENELGGISLPPPKPQFNELFIKQGATKSGVKVIPGRGSVLTKVLPGNKDRGACFFCWQCGRSCKVYGRLLVFAVPGDSGAENQQPEGHHQRRGPRGADRG